MIIVGLFLFFPRFTLTLVRMGMPFPPSTVPVGQIVEEVDREMTIRLDDRNRPEADVLATSVPLGSDLTWFAPADVLLAIEVMSPESAHRDRTVNLRKYAEAGIAHYWIVEEHDTKPIVHVYELDEPTSTYVAAGIFRGELEVQVPFPITLDLDNLVRVKPWTLKRNSTAFPRDTTLSKATARRPHEVPNGCRRRAKRPRSQ